MKVIVIGGCMALLGALAGCQHVDVITKVEHRLVAADDNLMVDCDIAEPPESKLYLATAPSKDATEVAKLQALLKTVQARERLLAEINLQQTANLHVCNKRWQGMRDFKAQAKQELDKLNSVKGK